jgi:alkylation response protein AidB-like acyl-CoA dehydrogenase
VSAKQADGWTLEGREVRVLGAPFADSFVVSARRRQGGCSSSAVEVRSYRRDDEQRAGDVVLEAQRRAPLKAAAPLIEELLDFAHALVCAEGVGAMKFACDTTLEYLKTRKQFGVPIGAFQALQHRMVDMFISLEQARSMACLACVEGRLPRRRSRASISAAKIKIADAARHISQESVQLHGGMGMSEELKISHASAA